MRVVVTGASGFLGRSVLTELDARGLDVVAVSRRPRLAVGSESCRMLSSPEDAIEVRELLRSANPQIVIHLAGISSVANYADLYQANAVFAANLLDASLAMPQPPLVLLTGSAAEYGPVPEAQLPVGEDFPCRPNTAYGISKLAQTGHALAARSRGLAVVVARLFNPIGGGMPQTLALGSFAHQIAQMGARGGVLRTGDLDVVRDFIDVAVAANLLVELALKHAGSEAIVNICSGQGQNLLTVTRRLIELAGLPIELVHDASRRGNSNVRSFVGNSSVLRSLGLNPSPPDMDLLLEKILRNARLELGAA